MTTIENIEQLLLDNDLEGTPFFTGDDYADAILGYTEDHRLVYSYEKMIEWLAQKDDISIIDAREWIDYNALRTIPYMGEKQPIIVYDFY